MSAKREIAAHHEAGHAVVAVAFGATQAKKSSSTVDHLEARKIVGASAHGAARGASSRQASSWEVSTSLPHQHAIITGSTAFARAMVIASARRPRAICATQIGRAHV